MPFLGHKRLDAITNEDVQRLKGWMQTKAAKTVNNVLTVLSVLLKKAVEWDVIERHAVHGAAAARCRSRRPASTTSRSTSGWSMRRKLRTRRRELIVLLGGEAGLRCGEMIALEWRDVDLAKRQLCVQRSDWNGQVTAPKSGRVRYIPLTRAPDSGTPRASTPAGSSRVLCQTRRHAVNVDSRCSTASNARRGRRTFVTVSTSFGTRSVRTWRCVGHPARAIQELAGHSELGVTQRYMHLSPAALDAAIQLLDGRGNIVATGSRRNWK